MLRYFATGADRPLLQDTEKIRRLYKEHRWRIFVWLIVGYGFFYTCRLSLSVAKKPMLDAGVMGVDEMGIKGVIGLFSYLGAATQDWISGFMIEATKQVTDGVAHYDFTNVFKFWIGASIASILLAMIAWNAKASE